MRDPETLQIVLVQAEGGPPEMDGVGVSRSWSYLHFDDQPVVTWDELTAEIDSATTPGDRRVHVEIDDYDWGASGPLSVVYEVALQHGLELALAALTGWVTTRFGPVRGFLSDTSKATKLALSYLRKHHKAADPKLESVVASSEGIELTIRDGHQRYRVRVRGEDAMIVEAWFLDAE